MANHNLRITYEAVTYQDSRDGWVTIRRIIAEDYCRVPPGSEKAIVDQFNALSADEARATVAAAKPPEAPWYPPEREGFGPWIEWRGGGSPVGGDVRVDWLELAEQALMSFRPGKELAARHLEWGNTRFPGRKIVAYRVKLDASERLEADGGGRE